MTLSQEAKARIPPSRSTRSHRCCRAVTNLRTVLAIKVSGTWPLLCLPLTISWCYATGCSAQSSVNAVRLVTTRNSPEKKTTTRPMSNPVVPNVTTARPRPRPRQTYNVPSIHSDPSAPPSAIDPSESGKRLHDVDDDFPLLSYTSAISEHAKMRSRAAKAGGAPVAPPPAPQSKKPMRRTKATSTSKQSTIVSSVIDISSDDDDYDELALRCTTSVESKTKRGSTHDNKVSTRDDISRGPDGRHPGPTLTIPAHTITFHANSPLPPSDPPSSLAPASEGLDHPPIAFLPSVPDTDTDLGSDGTRLQSSPPIAPSTRKMRKRRKIGVIHPVLDNDLENDPMNTPGDIPISRKPIPPPFFACSSQSEPAQETAAPMSSDVAPPQQSGKDPKTSSKARGKRKAFDDEGMNESSDVQAKPKARRKRDRKLRDENPSEPTDTDHGQIRLDENSSSSGKDILVPAGGLNLRIY